MEKTKSISPKESRRLGFYFGVISSQRTSYTRLQSIRKKGGLPQRHWLWEKLNTYEEKNHVFVHRKYFGWGLLEAIDTYCNHFCGKVKRYSREPL
ncbi:hypothetical protein ACFLRC_02355 [Candidatus Altiarchaeota archaeon]